MVQESDTAVSLPILGALTYREVHAFEDGVYCGRRRRYPTVPDDFSAIETVGGDATAATDGSVTADATYAYRVTAAIDGVGESEPTDPSTITLGSVGPFAVSIVATNSPLDSGDTLEVEVDVTNQGDFSGETEVVLELTD